MIKKTNRPQVHLAWLGIGLWLIWTLSGTSVQAERPSIGLALSGGGARGLAHIGILRWFAEQRIPIDYIAGTSMGGLVGGLYAGGVDPESLRELIQGEPWSGVLRAAPTYSDLSYRRKEDRRRFPGILQLGWRDGLKIQSGLSDAHFIGLLISRLSVPYSFVSDFDALPIPFRAVATDLVSGERVILGEGSLAQALEATIAIPGVFPPVEINGQILVDGGLLNNLPTDVVRKMGADVVIAVNVGTPLMDKESLSSFFGILDQSIGVMMLENVRQNLLLADIILTPDLQHYGSGDFASGEALIELGYQSAQAKQVILQGLSVNQDEWDRYRNRRESRKMKDGLEPTFVEVEGTNGRGQEEISRRLSGHAGRSLDTDALESDLNSIYGLGRYRSLDYRGILRDGRKGLRVGVHSKTHGPPFINLGLEINGAETDNVRFGFNSRITFLDVGGPGTEWRVDLGVGSRLLAATEFYRPLGAGFFVAPRSFAERTVIDLFQSGARTSEYRSTSRGVGVDLGFDFGNKTDEIRLGYQISHLDADTRIGSPLLPTLEGPVGMTSLRWVHDGLDSSIIPRQGWRIRLEPRWYFQSPQVSGGFPQTRVKLALFRKVREWGSVFLLGEGATTFDDTAPPAQQLTLGGPLRLGAFGSQEFRGSRLVFSSQGYIHHIASLSPFLGGKIYAGLWHEVGAVFERDGPRDYRSVISTGFLADTFLGPALIGASWGEAGQRRLYFSVGSLF